MTDIKIHQPVGLWVLSCAQVLERCSYYMLRSAAVFYLIYALQMSRPQAMSFYGAFTSIIMIGGVLAGIVGGLLGDFLGHRPMIIAGAVLAALGMVLFSANSLYPAAVAIAIGGGLFRNSIFTQTGLLYPRNDARRDGGFTYLYLAVNLGAFAAPFFATYFGDGADIAFKGVFYTAAFLQLLAAALVLGCGKLLKACQQAAAQEPAAPVRAGIAAVVLLACTAAFLLWSFVNNTASGAGLNLFVSQFVDRMLPSGWEIPASWFQAVNPYTVILFAFVMPWVYVFNRRFNTVLKMAGGLWLILAGVAVFLFAASQADGGAKVSMAVILPAMLFMSAGEILIAPLIYSAASNYAPRRFEGLFMGLVSGAARLGMLAVNFLVGKFSARFLDGALQNYYMPLVIYAAVGAIIITLLAALLKKPLKAQDLP
jgi:POT family proton-dependent oligopeptide transporter